MHVKTHIVPNIPKSHSNEKLFFATAITSNVHANTACWTQLINFIINIHNK